MNIAIFSPNQNPYSETFIQAHKNCLRGNVFYYYGSGSQIQLEGHSRLMPLFRYKILKVFAKLVKKPSAYLWQERVLYNLKANKIDAVLVEYGNHAYHLKQVLFDSGLPVAVHFHGYDGSEYQVIDVCNDYKEVFKLSKKIVVVSKVMEKALLTMGCPSEKLVYNVYGPKKEFENIVPSYSKKQFLSVGRFTDKKAPYYTIMAFRKVISTHPEAKLLMAGDGALLNMCKNLVKQLQLEKSVFFLGIITSQDFINLLGESLAFVQHSITADNGDMEGTPVAILEASAAGLPVISTYHAGIPDVVEHKTTGLLGEEHDIETMSMHMLQVLDDVNFAKKLGKSGKLNITENFSLDRHINNLQNILENVV